MKKLRKILINSIVFKILVQFLAKSVFFRNLANRAGYVTYKFYPPGHYYSPIADLKEIEIQESIIFNKDGRNIPGVDLHENEQLGLLRTLSSYYPEMPFTATKQEGLRYYFENDYCRQTDGILLYSMLRHFRPKKIIEVGSGFSSCVLLDTNELFFAGGIQIEFIEPYPERLYSLLNPRDHTATICRDRKLQEIPLDVFKKLNEGDILFIDSSHVSRVASDVNYYMFEIFPILKSGVLIHIHDIFNNFEYPKYWIYEGRSWNENYLLRAFLQYNDAFEIVLFNSFLTEFHEKFFRDHMPLAVPVSLIDKAGSIWLRKVRD